MDAIVKTAKNIGALTEGRGKATCEIGMAIVNLNRPSMILCQLSDTQSYVNTLTKINILNPTEILVPLTFIEGRFQNRLLEKIQQQFSNIKITGYARSAFNKANGIDRVKSLCLPQYDSVILGLQHKYYCLSAVSALLLYIENVRNVYYARESVKIVYEESEGSMIIDVSAADKLELVTNERIVEPGKNSSLLAVLNHCLTRIGNRTLRAMILQPPCCIPNIEARLDCVTELISKSDLLEAMQAILMKLNNIDQLLSLATLLPDSIKSYSERQLNYLLLLNLILDQITPLKEILSGTTQPIFLELCETLNSSRFKNLKDILVTTFQSDAYPTKGSNATMQRCFAIKPGVNSLLDAVRKTYSEILDEMREYVAELGRKYGLNLTLGNNNKKGFHIVLPLTPQQKRTLKKSDLPPEFTQICRLCGSFTMKTEELTTYSVRIEDTTANILQISNGIVRGLLIETRNYLDLFYKLVEQIARLDVIQSLAEASRGNSYVRPRFADYTDISNAKHPMLDMICSKEPVANPIQASKEYNMHIITGPNGSGKSIYIRQVALIQIMAQVGCFVPATSATLRICDRLFTRISLDDNLECNISTFELELLEIKHCLTTMTKNSLVIIDELCRSTAVEEGTALAMAICETILMTPAFIFFTTHYTIITRLQELYYNVKVWQMEATVTGTDVTDTKLDLKYHLIPGCTSLKRYSIYLLAKMWPQDIVKYIENILDDVSRKQVPQNFKVEGGVTEKAKLIYEVKWEIDLLKQKNQITPATINTILNKYQHQLEVFGVKIINEADEGSEKETKSGGNNEEILSATQVSFNYIPAEDVTNGSVIEKTRDFVEENSTNLNYLIPDMSLHENTNPLYLSYLSSQDEPDFNTSYGSIELIAQTYPTQEKFVLTPLQSINSQQNINSSGQFFNISQSPSFFVPNDNSQAVKESQYFMNEPEEFHVNSQALNATPYKRSISSNSQKLATSSRTMTAPVPFTFHSSEHFLSDTSQNSKPLFTQEDQYPSPQFSTNPSTQVFHNAQEINSSSNILNNSKLNSSMNQFSFDLDLFGETEITSTPIQKINDSSIASSINSNKFMTCLRETSTPMRKSSHSTPKATNSFLVYNYGEMSQGVPVEREENVAVNKIRTAGIPSTFPTTNEGQSIEKSEYTPGRSMSGSTCFKNFKETSSPMQKTLNPVNKSSTSFLRSDGQCCPQLSDSTGRTEGYNEMITTKVFSNQTAGKLTDSTQENRSVQQGKPIFFTNYVQKPSTSFLESNEIEVFEEIPGLTEIVAVKEAIPSTSLSASKSQKTGKLSANKSIHETSIPYMKEATTPKQQVANSMQRASTSFLGSIHGDCYETIANLSRRNITGNEMLVTTPRSTFTANRSQEIGKPLDFTPTRESMQDRSFSFKTQTKGADMSFSANDRPSQTPINDKSSLNSSMFLEGITTTSTPFAQNDFQTTFDDYSINYSPLCDSPPRKLQIQSDPTASSSTTSSSGKTFRMKRRFVPPNKLTKRQIQEEFAEQTRKMMECSDSSKVSDYALQIRNRPTVKQLQQSEYIANIKRTESGVVITPAPENTRKRKKAEFTFNRNATFAPNLLSDANEEKFMEFLEKNKTKHRMEEVSLTPDGFYKQNKNEINRIMNKYLNPEPMDNMNCTSDSDLFD